MTKKQAQKKKKKRKTKPTKKYRAKLTHQGQDVKKKGKRQKKTTSKPGDDPLGEGQQRPTK